MPTAQTEASDCAAQFHHQHSCNRPPELREQQIVPKPQPDGTSACKILAGVERLRELRPRLNGVSVGYHRPCPGFAPLRSGFRAVPVGRRYTDTVRPRSPELSMVPITREVLRDYLNDALPDAELAA